MEVEVQIVSLKRAETFRISRGSSDIAEVVQVSIESNGVTGFGEGSPIARYGESAASAAAYVDVVRDQIGDDPFDLEAILGRLPREQFAAQSAIDAALHDLVGKLLDQPVWRFLGLRQGGPPTTMTIGIKDPDATAQAAEKLHEDGRFRWLKLKLGGGDGLDLERVRAARRATNLPFQVDANEYWSLSEALDALPQLAELGVRFCEQPLRAGDPGGEELKKASMIPIFVDEDCHTLEEVAHCSTIAHGINVKLAKSGGIREAVRMVHAARALGLGVMIGCIGESSLGISAGAQIASLFDYADLDGNLSLRADPWQGVELVDGVQTPSNRPGLGVVERQPGSIQMLPKSS